jgi:RNA recognition motif-containing protein
LSVSFARRSHLSPKQNNIMAAAAPAAFGIFVKNATDAVTEAGLTAYFAKAGAKVTAVSRPLSSKPRKDKETGAEVPILNWRYVDFATAKERDAAVALGAEAKVDGVAVGIEAKREREPRAAPAKEKKEKPAAKPAAKKAAPKKEGKKDAPKKAAAAAAAPGEITAPYVAFFGNLPKDMTAAEVSAAFTGAKDVRVLNKGLNTFAYGEFATKAQLEAAVKLSGKDIGGREVKVDVATPAQQARQAQKEE